MYVKISKTQRIWSSGSTPEVNIPKWSWSIIFSRKTTKPRKKLFLKKFFGLESQKNRFFAIGRPDRNFRKNREISQIGPGRSDKLRNPPQTCFLDSRRSMRSKWGIYQPRTTIFEEVMLLWSWTIFGRFPGNPILVDLWMWDAGYKKFRFLKKLFLRIFSPWEMFFMFLA